MRKEGYGVTIFEAHEKLGGMLYWGIPSYRLPKDVLERETTLVTRLGIEVRYNTRVGKDISLKDIRTLSTRSTSPAGPRAAESSASTNEETPGVMSGVEFLRLTNKNKRRQSGERSS